MPDALMVCPESPYPVAGGGPLRTACVLEYLATKYALDVIVFQEPGAPDPRVAFPSGLIRSIAVVPLPYHSKSKTARAMRNLRRYVRAAPPLVDRFSGFQLPIAKDYDVAVVEHFWCAPYIHQLRSRCRRVVLDLHNIESILLSRCASTESMAGRAVLQRFARACRELESDLLPAYDLLLVPSIADQAASIASAIVVPNTIPLQARPRVGKENAVVFSGNMAYHPNVAAARYFAQEIWPRLSGVEWWIVGKNAGTLDISGEGIRVVESVDNAIHAIASAKVAVVPLLSGSGTRFKILEAWAAGVPVVSTTIGAEGLDATPGEHLLIADSPAEFAEAVMRVSNRKEEAEHLSTRGRALYEARFTWPSAWKILTEAGL